ncbi:hypothetical protein [Stenotrophomonas maltophilia]|uniref:hypothetical protein n=1 Tax=Stenotrophomonas maltophilia TaxID=40324 RepID=UPI002E76F9BA|nr:hypothetical protein [Stenotrophomonas maltophilia]
MQDVQACQNVFSLPTGWQVQAAGEQRWLLKGTGERPLQVTLQCITELWAGPEDPVTDSVLGPLEPKRMSAAMADWGAARASGYPMRAFQRRIVPGTEVQEIAELPRADRANPNAPHGLLMLRWNEEDTSHIQQREAFIATLTQSLEAPGAPKNTTGTAP